MGQLCRRERVLFMRQSAGDMIIGRFAPSPTGPLHFGSLVAAVGSYLAARATAGRWLLRVEDLDPPRVVPGAADDIVRLLEVLGFQWDNGIVWQSQRRDYYFDMLNLLKNAGRLFDCTCSRREVLASAPHIGEEGPVYPGFCRNGPGRAGGQSAVRIRVSDEIVSFDDCVLGVQRQNLEKQVGDFVLYRADGQFAYQLAVVADDIAAGVNQVVRGADLLFSTPRQIFLYHCFGQTAPRYGHLPLVLGKNGEKLSKRDGPAVLVSADNGAELIWHALDFLGQQPPGELKGAAARELLSWGTEFFSIEKVPSRNSSVAFC